MNSHGGRNEFIVFIVAQFPVALLAPAPDCLAHESDVTFAKGAQVVSNTTNCKMPKWLWREALILSSKNCMRKGNARKRKPFTRLGREGRHLASIIC